MNKKFIIVGYPEGYLRSVIVKTHRYIYIAEFRTEIQALSDHAYVKTATSRRVGKECVSDAYA